MSTEEAQKLPAGWQWRKLGDLCDLDRQMIEPSSDRAKDLPYLSLEHIEAQTGRISRDPLEKVEDEGKSTTFFFDSRHVLYGKLRPYLNKVALPEFEGRCTTEAIPLLPRDNTDRLFLAWLLRRKETVAAAMAEKTGSRMPRANMDDLLKLEVPLPPLPEQKRIVAFLTEQMAAVEKARTAAEARLQAVKELPAAYIRDSYEKGGRTNRRLADCLVHISKGVGPTWADYPVLGATRAGLAPAKEGVGKAPERYKLVDEGTVFYNPMRILLGSIAMIDEGDEPGITSPDYVALKGRDGVVNSRWFYYWMRSPYGESFIKSMSRGAVRERMLFNRLAEGEVEFPSWHAQQEAAEKMKHVRPIQTLIEEEINAINAMPALLLQRAFQGEL